MGLIDLFKGKRVGELENRIMDLENVITGVQNQPKNINRTVLMENLLNDNAYRYKQTIAKWRESLEYIEGDNNYTDPLYQIFRELYLDSQIQSTVLLRKSRITQLPFEIEWKNESMEKEEDPIIDSVYNLFNSKWFYDFMGNALDYMYEGYVALEITKIESDNINIEKIPFNHLKPRYGVFVKNKTDIYTNGIKLNEEPYSNYVMEIFNSRKDLGIYTKLVPLFLWSKNAHQSWSQYAEIFGMPIRIGKTVKQEVTERKKLYEMLKNMGSSLSVLLDKEDDIQFLSNANSDAFNVYNELIKLCNDEINKLILGATMINSDGSSYSQSQVHQLQFDSLIKQDIRSMEHIINNILIPKLVNLGVIPEGLKFEFDTSESLDIFQKFEIDKALLPYYELDIEYLNKMYNTSIVGSKALPIIPSQNGIEE